MSNFPTNSTDPTCPVSSESFWDNDGNLIDNSHIHDNRYYTKDEIDNIFASRDLIIRPVSRLLGGVGLQSFEFNGVHERTIHLDFETPALNPMIRNFC